MSDKENNNKNSGPDLNKIAEKAGKVAKEVGFVGGKLIKDMSKSVKEIIDDYKNRKDDEPEDKK